MIFMGRIVFLSKNERPVFVARRVRWTDSVGGNTGPRYTRDVEPTVKFVEKKEA